MDFNPRMGIQFRLFETTSDVDVVRALHLDLTGRKVPFSPVVKRRKLVIEHADWPARLAYRHTGYSTETKQHLRAPTELAWLAPDDPLPFFRMLLSLLRSVVSRLTSILGR
jgi:hypothetical protein